MSLPRLLLSTLVVACAAAAQASPIDPPVAMSGLSDLDVRELTLVLPDHRRWTAHRTHFEHDALTTAWTGEVATSPGSRITITRHRSVTTGVVVVEGRTFELRPDATGGLAAVEVRPADLPPLEPPSPRAAATTRKPDVVDWRALGLPGADVVPVAQDVLVLYTAASARRYGTTVLESMIVGGIAAANAAYRDSGVGITLRLVGLQRSATVTEAAGGMVDTLARVKASAEVAQLRDQLGADMVLLVNENDDWCGYAYIMYRPSAAYADDAFGAVRSSCLSSDSVAHEIGHLQGLMHDRESISADGALPYGHGYRRCERGGFRDVMAYQCEHVDVPRLRLFSNPDRFYRGVPTGVAHETDPAHSADAARALNETAPLVASYRASAAGATPSSPLALTAYSRGRVARLAWRDGTMAAAAFIVERASTGAYEEIARVASRVTSFRDRTVEQGKTYSYRVRATNGGGSSAASNAVTVTIGVPGQASPSVDVPGVDRTARPRSSSLQRR